MRAQHLAQVRDVRGPAQPGQPADRVTRGPGTAATPPAACPRARSASRVVMVRPSQLPGAREARDRVQQPVHLRRGEVGGRAGPRRSTWSAGPGPGRQPAAAPTASRRAGRRAPRGVRSRARRARRRGPGPWGRARPGVSTSKQRVPGGQGSRNARASKPAPSSTTWRQPCWPASASRSSRNRVRATTQTRRATAPAAPGRRVQVQTARFRERRGQRVGEQAVGAGGLKGPDGRDGQPGAADALQRDRCAGRGAPGPRPWPGPPGTPGPPGPRTRSASSRPAASSATVSASPFRPARTIQHARISGRAQIAPASRPISSSPGVTCSRVAGHHRVQPGRPGAARPPRAGRPAGTAAGRGGSGPVHQDQAAVRGAGWRWPGRSRGGSAPAAGPRSRPPGPVRPATPPAAAAGLRAGREPAPPAGTGPPRSPRLVSPGGSGDASLRRRSERGSPGRRTGSSGRRASSTGSRCSRPSRPPSWPKVARLPSARVPATYRVTRTPCPSCAKTGSAAPRIARPGTPAARGARAGPRHPQPPPGAGPPRRPGRPSPGRPGGRRGTRRDRVRSAGPPVSRDAPPAGPAACPGASLSCSSGAGRHGPRVCRRGVRRRSASSVRAAGLLRRWPVLSPAC